MLDWLRILFLIIFPSLLASLPVTSAQATDDVRPGTIKGQVHSADTGQPLPGANVALRRVSDSSLVTGTTTDSTGQFAVDDLEPGAYALTASFVGYAPRTRTVTLPEDQSVLTVKPLRLARRTAEMEQATVSARRPFVTTKGSKRIYDFEKSEVALGGKSAVDVLRDLPSLRIDALDGAIRLRGNQSVALHVNGEPVAMSGKALVQYLKGLSATDVQRVEINTNPSARHDAEGTAGIVNIVLDRTQKAGLSGGVSGALGTGPRIDGSGNLGYQQDPFTLYGSYSYSRTDRSLDQTLLRHRPDLASSLLLKQSSEEQQTYGGHSFNAEIEYSLTPATTLSLTSTGSVWSGDQKQETIIHLRDTPTRTRKVRARNRSVHLDERLTARHEFAEKNHELSADLRYQTEDDRDQVRETRSVSSPRHREVQTEEGHEASLNVDYVRPIDAWTVETGYKASYRLLDQAYDVTRLESPSGGAPTPSRQRTGLTFDEVVHAGYGTLQRTIGSIDAEVGVRIEHTEMTTHPDGQPAEEHRYTDLFPSASLTYEMAPGRQVSVSYSKRVDRPSAHQLRAFDASSDEYIRFVGNPNLEPEQIHKAELTIMQKVGPATLTISPYARRKTNAIEWTTIPTDSVTVRTFENYDARTSYGTELTSSLNVGEVQANLSGNLFRRSTQGGTLEPGASRSAMAVMGRANVTWTLIDDLRLQVSQMYRSPLTAGLGRIDAFARTSASVETTFLHDRATLGVQVEDPFDTSQIGLEKRTDRYRESITRDWDGRSVSLSFSYRFGDADHSQRKNRSSSSQGSVGPMGGG